MREGKILIRCWWECKLVQSLWKSVWRLPQKIEIDRPHDPAAPLLVTYPEDSVLPQRHFLIHVHCCSSHKSQDMETALVAINR